MSQTPTLDVFLIELTKDSIHEAAQWLGVSIPKSWKKERMASALAEQYESNPSTLLPLLGLPTIMFLRSLGENAPDGRFAWRKQRDNVKLLPDITADLRHFGLILPDDEHHEFIVAPIALQLAHSASEQDLRHAEHLQLVELCATGVLNTYGVLEKKEFIRILNRCYSDLSADFLSIFVEARTGLLQRADRYSEENGNLWWCSEWMEEPDAWIDEIQTRSDIAYKLYSEDVYLHAVLHGYPKKPRNFDRLTKLLEAHGIDHDEAEDMLHDEILDHNNELQPRAAVPAFMKVIVWESMDEAQRVMSLIMEFSNDTPLWINKGHAPAELSRKLPPYIGKPTFMGAFADEMNAAWDRRIQDAPRRESPGAVVPFPPPNPQVRPFPTPSALAKVGRNDPCPCGSGKKYKHCCGKNT